MKKALLIFIFFSVACLISAEDITVSVSRKTIGINESFSIEFSSEDVINGQPDFSPLQKDFKILSNSQSHNRSIINGHVKQSVSWVLELFPKHEGQLVIPSISFGKSSSTPVAIEISSVNTAEPDETLFLESEVYPKKSVYEQTQFIFTVRLFRSVNLAQGTLSDIQVSDPDAIIERLGNDVEYEHYHQNGRRYIVLERKYAILPQHPGELMISPVVFEGKVVTGGNSFFNVQTQYKRAVSNQETVEVKPIPYPFQKHNWLGANDVKLTEEWSADPSLLTLGEPITWTLTLSADGCMGNNLPPISFNLPSEFKQYADKPLIENNTKGNGVIGTRQTKIALIASKTGTIALPEIVVQWWDLKNETLRETKLPARTVQVEAAQVAMNDSMVQENASAEIILPSAVASSTLPIWAWGLIGMNAIWMVGLGYLVIRKINFKFSRPDSLKGLKSQLKIACNANDAKQAEVHLLAWAALVFPERKVHSIMELKDCVSEELKGAIDVLYRSLYGNRLKWQGDSLWQAFASFKVNKGSKRKAGKNDKILKELYFME